MEDILIGIAAKVFEVDLETAKNTEYFFDFEIWDSLKQVQFINLTESEFGIKFDRKIIFQFFTRQDVIDAIQVLQTS